VTPTAQDFRELATALGRLHTDLRKLSKALEFVSLEVQRVLLVAAQRLPKGGKP
jgi:hypothetical protein